MEVDSEILEARYRLKWDTPLWARNCATILTPRKEKVRLVARPWQARTGETPVGVTPLDEALERQRAAGLPMRVLVLKARKLGFSTWVVAKTVQRVTQQPNQHALMVAHRGDAATQLFDMGRRIYDHLPTSADLGVVGEGGFSIKPQLIGQNTTRGGGGYLILGDKMRPTDASVLETMTAGGKGGGRASTPSILHLSECAHYEDPDFEVGVLNAVPDEPETIVVKESTANGFNAFYEAWMRAIEGAEDPDTGGLYLPLFYPWQANPFNARAFVSPEARARFEATLGDEDGGGDEEELELIEAHGCSLEQLFWRRNTIVEKCAGKVETFHQEHPTTPEQAFIGSGTPVFPGILIARAIKEAQEAPEPVTGVLRGMDELERRTKTGTILVPQRALWIPEPEPVDVDVWGATWRLRVWEHPVQPQELAAEPTVTEQTPEYLLVEKEQQAAALRDEHAGSGQYVLFADIASGSGSDSDDKDFSAIQVLDHVTMRQVASYHSRIPIHDLPRVILLLAIYYNHAWVAPEVTGLGIGVVDALAKDYRYPRIYRRRRAGDDRRQDAREELLGWSTDRRTKPLMEQTFGQALRDGTHGLRCARTARQLTTYVEDDRGNHGAQSGSHDDLVMSYMGACRVASELAPRAPRKKRASGGRRPADDITGY